MPGIDANALNARLRDVPFVRQVVVLESTASTNDDVRRLAAQGAEEGTVVLAERQTAGRGRLGRSWNSPDRLGLYVSVLLRPKEAPEALGRYAIAAAVAVCAACREHAGDLAVLKWPNDVLAGGRKLAGILSELRHGESGAELVVGVGINVNQAFEDFDPALRGSATSLRMLRHGVTLDREAVAATLLQAFGESTAVLRAASWPAVAERFLGYAPQARGYRVRLAGGRQGVTDGLAETGALRVVTGDGVVLVHASESVVPDEE